MTRPRTTALFTAALTCCACRSEDPAATASPTQLPSAAASASARRPVKTPLVDERVEIPGGAFRAGSVPGQPGRQPELEPALRLTRLGPFVIDRLPYPNDPEQPPLTEVTRGQATRLCAERGARLCTELEWERACKGPKSEPFITGKAWEPTCGKGVDACASPFDVLGMSVLREWTASDVVPARDDAPRLAAVRGAPADAPAADHRCARRRGVDPATRSSDLGFRCCKGAPNAAVVKEPREGQTFRKISLKAQRLSELLRTHPQTEALAADVKLFREPDAANTVIARGPGDRKGFLFTVKPLLWNPVAGAEFLVVAARSGDETSFVVVYHVLGEDEYALASSYVLKDEIGPVALAYNGYIRPRLHFSTCWGCPGETGKILYRDPDSVIILQP